MAENTRPENNIRTIILIFITLIVMVSGGYLAYPIVNDDNNEEETPPSTSGELNPDEDPLGAVFLIIECTKRGEDGRCNEATCTREEDPNSPTGLEVATCSQWSLSCEVYGHTQSGDGRNNSTCTRSE